MTETYRIKIDGLKDGSIRDHVVYQLVILFKRSQKDVQRILDTKGMVVKKGLELHAAIKYKVTIEQCGCQCIIEPEQEPVAVIKAASGLAVVEGGSASGIAGVSAATQRIEPMLSEQSDEGTDANIVMLAPGLSLIDHEPEPVTACAPAAETAGPVAASAAEIKEATEKVVPIVSNEIGTTINGDPFLVQTPQSFCCNCGVKTAVTTIETDFFRDLIFSTRFEKDKAILLALPYCPECAEGVGRYPMSSPLKWLLAFCVYFGFQMLITSQVNVSQKYLIVRLLFLLAPIVPSVLVFRWMGQPKAPKTSSYTPVKIKEFSRNPNSTRYEGQGLVFISAIAAVLGVLFKHLSKQNPDKIKKLTIKFSNPAYAKEFRKKNKNFIQEGLIKII